MRPILLLSALLAAIFGGLVYSAPRDPNIADTDPRTPADEVKAFHLPAGFEMQLVASEPDIHKPLNIAFDQHGRLWVTDTVEYPFPAKKNPRDSVKILEDFGPDGRAHKITTFAGGLNIPIGVIPLPTDPAQALVYSIPDIWRIQKDGARAIAYKEYGHRDTHGMTNSFTRAFDDWIYACHGFSNSSTVTAADGSKVSMNSGNTYRFKSDGSRIEAYTHGQVNPFGLCFDPLGNLYSADCHSQPIYQLLRGGYYPSFGKPDDGLGFAPEMFTGYTDSTAIAGVVYYAADHFPPEYRGSALIGDVVTNRLVRFKISWHGSSPVASMDYFLKSDDPWFRPVALQLGPDGALYIADFYNRIIGHYEVPLDHPGRDRERGRIWRIVYKGPGGQGTPGPRTDWTKATVADLLRDLEHPNLTVRTLATTELVARGGAKVGDATEHALKASLVKPSSNEHLRAHALWVLERSNRLPPDLLLAAARDGAVEVRVHACRILASRTKWTDPEHAAAINALTDADANVRRAAADALSLHPATTNLRPLLDLRAKVAPDDTHLLYVVRMALRDQLLPPGAYEQLARKSLQGNDAAFLADVSLGAPSAASGAFLLQYLQTHAVDGELLTRMVHHVARYGDARTSAAVLEFACSHRPADLSHQAELIRAIVRGTQERGNSIDGEVRERAQKLVLRMLDAKKPAEIKDGIELAGSLQYESVQPRIAALAADNSASNQVRAAALTTLASLDPKNHAAALGRVLNDASSAIGLREQAASLMARGNRADTLATLVQALPSAPARLQTAIAVGLAGSKTGAEKLLDAVVAGKASARLLQERAVEVKLKEAKIAGLPERLAKLTAGLPPADEKLNGLMKKRKQGFAGARADANLGKQVFEKNCANCHQLAGKGAKIGPQLDGVGIRGVDRLLEDTLDPNRNVDQAFRLTTIVLRKGQVVSGLVLREEGAVIVLADNQGKEVRVPKDSVEERSTSQQSPMPANFADQIPEPDFYHLLAYLLQQRVGSSQH